MNNQNGCEQKPFSWWCSVFRENVRRIGHTLLVLMPWHNPIPLTRAWVLFEIYITITSAARFSVLLPRCQIRAFRHALIHQFDQIVSALSQVDSEKALAFRASDKEMIFEVIRQSIGFHKLNTLVLDALRNWLLSSLESFVQRSPIGLSDSHTKTPAEPQPATSTDPSSEAPTVTPPETVTDAVSETLRLQYAIGRLSIILGRIASAESLLRQVAQRQSQLMGPRHIHTLTTRTFWAMSLYRLGEKERSFEEYQQTLGLLHATVGQHHPIALYCLSGLGWVSNLLDRLDLSLQYSVQCFDFRKEVLGPDHPETLISMNNVGSILSKVDKNVEALSVLSSCFEIREKILGSRYFFFASLFVLFIY